jgi:MFS family permease
MKWLLVAVLVIFVLGGITVATVSVGGFEIEISAFQAVTHYIGLFISAALESLASAFLYLILPIVVVKVLWEYKAFRKVFKRGMLTSVWLFFGLVGAVLYFVVGFDGEETLAIEISYWCFGIAGLFFIWREVLGFLDRRESKSESKSEELKLSEDYRRALEEVRRKLRGASIKEREDNQLEEIKGDIQ